MKYFKILLLFLFVLFISACNELKVTDSSTVKELCTEYDLDIEDDPNDIIELENDAIASITECNSPEFNVFFYELNSENDAKNAYSTEKDALHKNKHSNVYKESESSIKNHSRYILSTNNDYYYLVRVDNTLLFLSGKEYLRDDIKKFGETLGYE